MRMSRSALMALLVTMLAGLPARAQQEPPTPETVAFTERMLGGPPAPGKAKSYACFVRTYDAAHLASHPQQKVSAMALLITVEKDGDDPQTRSYDGIASTWFDDTAAMRVSATTEEYRLTREDEANFISGHLPFVITREHVLREPPPA